MVNGEDLLERERFSQLSGHLTAQGPRWFHDGDDDEDDEDDEDDDDGDDVDDVDDEGKN